MNVNDTYILIQYIINKNQGSYLSPSEFNTIINQAQRSYISYLIGSLQKYQYGRAVAPVELGNSMTLRQILSPVIKETQLTINSSGFCSYPTDFVLTDAMWTITGLNRIRAVEQDKLYSFYNSQIDPVNEWPIYLIKDTGFQFYPVSLGSAILSYVKEAPSIIWAYTFDGNGRPVYSENGLQLATTASGVDWTGTGFAGGYTHTVPSTPNSLTSALAAIQGTYYKIVLTITPNVVPSGYVTLTFGGLSITGSTGVLTLNDYAVNNNTLSITPYDNFNGTVQLTINQASAQPVWGDTTMLDIISRALLMVGVNLQAPQIISYANEIKNTGQ